MRRLLPSTLVILTVALAATGARAQTPSFSPGFSDPFFLYYGYYLPHQAALAAQPTVTTQLQDVAAARQNFAMQERSGSLYGPMTSPFEMTGPNGEMLPYGAAQRGAQRLPRLPAHFATRGNANNTRLPHFNELSSRFPTARTGSFVNQNIVGSGRGGSSLMGMPGMGMPYAPRFGR